MQRFNKNWKVVYKNGGDKVPAKCSICSNLDLLIFNKDKTYVVHCSTVCSEKWENFKLNKSINRA